MITGGLKNRMKWYSMAMLLFVAWLLSSCGKDGAQVPTALSSSNLSGYANNEYITFNGTAINHGDTVLDIYGTWATNIGQTYNLNMLNLKFKGTSSLKGSYQLNDVSEGEYYSYYTGSSSTSYVFYYNTNGSNIGTVIITAYDAINNTVTGTFSFTGINTGQNTISINNGAFNRIPVTP